MFQVKDLQPFEKHHGVLVKGHKICPLQDDFLTLSTPQRQQIGQFLHLHSFLLALCWDLVTQSPFQFPVFSSPSAYHTDLVKRLSPCNTLETKLQVETCCCREEDLFL